MTLNQQLGIELSEEHFPWGYWLEVGSNDLKKKE